MTFVIAISDNGRRKNKSLKAPVTLPLAATAQVFPCIMKFLSEIRKHQIRFLKHVGVMSCYLGLGLSLGIVGPTLLDLRQQVQGSITQISFCLTSRAAGYALGSLASEYSMWSCGEAEH